MFEDYDLYNLKSFDSIRTGKEAEGAGTPVTAPAPNGDSFVYRMCSGSWAMSDEYFKAAVPASAQAPASCAGSAEAYLIQGG